jgi:sensor domain CHASE-containing protein
MVVPGNLMHLLLSILLAILMAKIVLWLVSQERAQRIKRNQEKILKPMARKQEFISLKIT